jgi:hypothetical protein
MSEVLRYFIISWGIGAGSLLLYALVKVIRMSDDRPKKEKREWGQVAPRCERCEHLSRIMRGRKGRKTYYCGKGEWKHLNCGYGVPVEPPVYCGDYSPRATEFTKEVDKRISQKVSQHWSELMDEVCGQALDEEQAEAVEQFCRENSYAPVVMCNDCKWWSGDLWACNKRGHGQAFSGPNFYCADGERKEKTT